jgi:hypothetical protein
MRERVLGGVPTRERGVSAGRSAGTPISPASIRDKTVNSKHSIDATAARISFYPGTRIITASISC